MSIVTVAGAPDARDDLNVAAVTAKPVTIDVLANDFAPAGINLATLRITQEPCNLTTGTCSPGTANFTTTPGKLVFTPAAAGSWNLAYTFTDNAGVVADQGLVAVAAQNAEVLTVKSGMPKWSAGTGLTGTIDAEGTSTISGGTIQMYVTPVGVADGCAAPTAAGRTVVASTTVGSGVWKFSKVAFTTKPNPVLYFYSPSSGSCIQAPLL